MKRWDNAVHAWKYRKRTPLIYANRRISHPNPYSTKTRVHVQLKVRMIMVGDNPMTAERTIK